MHCPRQVETCELEECRDEVDAGDRLLADFSLGNLARHADDQRRADVGVVRSQLRFESVLPPREALVRREHDERVVGLPGFLNRRDQPADGLIQREDSLVVHSHPAVERVAVN